jgi:hypothetical protein
MKPSTALVAFFPLALAAPVTDPAGAHTEETRAYGSYLYEDAGKDLPTYTDYGAYKDAGTYRPVIYYDNDVGEVAKYSDYDDYKDTGTDKSPNGIIAYNNYGKYTGLVDDAPKGDNAPAWWQAYAEPPQGWGDYGKYKRRTRRVRRVESVPVAEVEK